MWCMELSSSCCAEMNIHIDLRGVSQRISVVSSRKSSHLYCIFVEHGIAMELLTGKWASSRVDLGYTELFFTPVVTSVFILSFDNVLGEFLVFHQENRSSLRV